jgi:hypothetical protein
MNHLPPSLCTGHVALTKKHAAGRAVLTWIGRGDCGLEGWCWCSRLPPRLDLGSAQCSVVSRLCGGLELESGA